MAALRALLILLFLFDEEEVTVAVDVDPPRQCKELSTESLRFNSSDALSLLLLILGCVKSDHGRSEDVEKMTSVCRRSSTKKQDFDIVFPE